MDKNKLTKEEEIRRLKALAIAQKIRDYCANTFEEEHLKVKETIFVLGAVCGQHCEEIEFLCKKITAETAMGKLFEVIKAYVEYDEGKDKNV